MDPSYYGKATSVPNAPRRGFSLPGSPRIWVIALGIAAAIGGGLLLMSINARGTPTNQLQHLQARLTTLDTLITLGSSTVTGSELRKVNADANALVASITADLTTDLKVLNVKKPDKVITASEADTSTFTDLEDARINGRFDREYTDALAHKLESTRALIQETYNLSARHTQLRSTLSDAYKNLGTVEDQLAKITK